jgi:hypothetical protein
MALARCDVCGSPKGRTDTYPYAHSPVGHPNSGVVCGKRGCENQAYLWLTEEEQENYKQGQRVFYLPTDAAKVRVT